MSAAPATAPWRFPEKYVLLWDDRPYPGPSVEGPFPNREAAFAYAAAVTGGGTSCYEARRVARPAAGLLAAEADGDLADAARTPANDPALVNAVAAAAQAVAVQHGDDWWLPLSLRYGIARAVITAIEARVRAEITAHVEADLRAPLAAEETTSPNLEPSPPDLVRADARREALEEAASAFNHVTPPTVSTESVQRLLRRLAGEAGR